LAGYNQATKTNIVYIEDLVAKLQQKDTYKGHNVQAELLKKFKLEPTMKFTAVVGNPPYQITTDTNFATPVYHLFFEAAKNLEPDYVSLIHPARFLFNAGATPKDWNKQMLNDKHLSLPLYELSSQKIFSGVDIKGGVCITLWDKNNASGGLGGIFVAYPELASALNKVDSGGFDSLIYAQTKTKKPIDPKFPTEIRIRPNYFHKFPKIFTEQRTNKSDIKVIGLEKGNRRTERFVAVDNVTDENLKKWKLLIPKSNGSGSFGEILSTPLVAEPFTGCTGTFIQIGSFASEPEANACLKYIKTKFSRAMLGTLKVTQDNPKSTWKNVPLQNFTKKSDIDWSQSIADIDQQLYKKYKLDATEIEFIERNVKPMT
jgi:hypothetical protein